MNSRPRYGHRFKRSPSEGVMWWVNPEARRRVVITETQPIAVRKHRVVGLVDHDMADAAIAKDTGVAKCVTFADPQCGRAARLVASLDCHTRGLTRVSINLRKKRLLKGDEWP